MIDINYFRKIDSEEKAYFIGFIAADGYIDKNYYKLTFCLNIQDKDILESFCKLTKCTNKIAERKVWDKRTKKYYYQCNLQVCCKKFVYNLTSYGLDNKKTKNYFIQNIPNKYIKDCIRGLIDGDGHIGKSGVSLITTIENIKFITDFLHNIKICDYKEEIKKENNLYKMYIYKDRFKFLDMIYKDNKICLSRKYKSYINTKKIFKNRTRIVKNRKVFVYKNNKFVKKYNSLIECSKELKIPACSISNQASGRIKQSHGYTFKLGETIKIKERVEKNGNIL